VHQPINDVVKKFGATFSISVFKTVILAASGSPKPHSYGQPISIYAPHSTGAEAYAAWRES
jgi:hypothetical protein